MSDLTRYLPGVTEDGRLALWCTDCAEHPDADDSDPIWTDADAAEQVTELCLANLVAIAEEHEAEHHPEEEPMTDPDPDVRLAELRRIATGEDWSPPERGDLAWPLDEHDQLTRDLAKARADRDGWQEIGAAREPLIGENARLTAELAEARGELADIPARLDELANALAIHHRQRQIAIRAMADVVRHRLDSDRDYALADWSPAPRDVQDAPQPHAERSAAGFAATETPETRAEPQRPAEAVVWRTPETWCAIHRIQIIDPDGWRGPTAPPWEQPVTEAEFWERAGRSTTMPRATQPGDPCRATLGATDIRCQLLATGQILTPRENGNRNHWEAHWHADNHGNVHTWSDAESRPE